MDVRDETLWNTDLAPTNAAQRTWRWYHFAALWVGMIVAVPSWRLAAGLFAAMAVYRLAMPTPPPQDA